MTYIAETNNGLGLCKVGYANVLNPAVRAHHGIGLSVMNGALVLLFLKFLHIPGQTSEIMIFETALLLLFLVSKVT